MGRSASTFRSTCDAPGQPRELTSRSDETTVSIEIRLRRYVPPVGAARGDVTAQLITLALVLIAINVLWQAPIAWAAETVRRWLSRAEVRRAVSRLSGAVLLAFSALMIYEHLV